MYCFLGERREKKKKKNKQKKKNCSHNTLHNITQTRFSRRYPHLKNHEKWF